MAARRLLLVMVLLLIASSLAAALVPPPPERTETTSSSATSTSTREAPAASTPGDNRHISQSIPAQAEEPARFNLKLGDQLSLAVTANRFVEVAIPGFGLIDSATRGSPARFDMLAERAGAFPVRTLEPRRTIAVISVSSG